MYLRQYQRKNIILVVLMILVIGMTIGYSVLKSYLTISGTSNITSDFRVVITNIEEGTMNSATTVNKTYDETSATFQVDLKKPGSTAEYIVTVENQGKLDATLDTIEGIDEANEKVPTEITFSLEDISIGDALNVGESKTFKVIVTYSTVATSLPIESKQLTLKLNYEQKVGSETPIINQNFATYLINNKVDTVINGTENGLYVVNNSGQISSELSDVREYRFIGANPDNYVMFNNELWRIIGIFDNKLKLIRGESIGKYAWDENNQNVWENSTLQHYLNETYYQTIAEEYKNIIFENIWHLGAIKSLDNALSYYLQENSIESLNDIPTTWVGKIALFYPSDYLYAVSTCCNNQSVDIYNQENCTSNNWLLNKSLSQWTLSYFIHLSSSASNLIERVFYQGQLSSYTSTTNLGVTPVLYLKESVNVLKGNGTKESPYIIQT